MSAQADEPIRLTWDEYVRSEELRHGGRRRELVDGTVLVMTGASERHDLTAQAIYDVLRPVLKGTPCRVFLQNRKLRTADDTGYYPDLLVRCGTAADRLFETDARLVVEVVSPSNDAAALTERLYAYQSLPSVELILFVFHQRRFVTVHRRKGDDWTERQLFDGVIQVVGTDLDIGGLWTDVDADATTD